MRTLKQSRRKSGPEKLEPIDWHEYANDAVLNGNMSTLYHRPPSEDPTAYASPEALLEIEKRTCRDAIPTVGSGHPVGITDTRENESGSSDLDSRGPAVGAELLSDLNLADTPAMGEGPTVGERIAVGIWRATAAGEGVPFPSSPPLHQDRATVGVRPAAPLEPPVGSGPALGVKPAVGTVRSKVKPIRDVHDALTLAGKVLYQAMYGPPDGAISKSCTKGYRQLAAETHLDKDTVRDLISEFKAKGIVRETGTYNSDTRSAKTYEVFSYTAILQMWREAGVVFVTSGRSRPVFCTAQADPLRFMPAVGRVPAVGSAYLARLAEPTVGE